MVEKRPYPGDHGAANGAKRSKPATPGADFLALAKAKAAAKAAEIKARAAPGGGQNGTATSPAPSTSQATAAVGGASERLAAMRARMNALKDAASAPSTDAQPKQNEPSAPKYATALGNRRTDSPMPAAKSAKAAPEEEEKKVNPYLDLKVAGPTRSKIARGMLFNQRGRYLAQASKLRELNMLEDIKRKVAERNRRAKLDENSERGFLGQPPPDVEWWDEGMLEEKTYDCIDKPSKVKIDNDDSIVTIYIQHPVMLKAPQDQLLIAVKPMYLTGKEQAKLRRMRRAEEHKEEQAKIRLGLEPPPPPKVKRGNMMRVMGEQAIADPTAVEMLVESQIQERLDKHVMENEGRKLSKEQRLAKLAENQQKDAQKGLHMCVFKVDSLAFGKHRYQIDHNAKQHSLTGITIFHPKLNVVVVEGGFYSIEKYKRLMLNRIKWTENAIPTEAQMEKQAADPPWFKSMDEKGELKDLSHNKCALVFEGEVKQRAFRKWGSKMCESDGEAKEILTRNKLDSLWALAKSAE